MVNMLGSAKARRMNRRWVMAVVIVGVGAAVWLWSREAGRAPQGREQPFTDLDAALASYKTSGWELDRAPPFRGCTRTAPEDESMVGKDGGVVRRVSDGNAVVEELRLDGNPEFDQLVVPLETPCGRQTLAVLKRARKPRGP